MKTILLQQCINTKENVCDNVDDWIEKLKHWSNKYHSHVLWNQREINHMMNWNLILFTLQQLINIVQNILIFILSCSIMFIFKPQLTSRYYACLRHFLFTNWVLVVFNVYKIQAQAMTLAGWAQKYTIVCMTKCGKDATYLRLCVYCWYLSLGIYMLNQTWVIYYGKWIHCIHKSRYMGNVLARIPIYFSVKNKESVS